MLLTNALFLAALQLVIGNYTPDWISLDSRPLPDWYDEVKIGVFIHWGVFSVPGFGSEWFWSDWEGKEPSFVEFMNKNYKPGFTYPEFASDFTAEFYNPEQWADIIKASGAKYVVLTSKHHEGYTLWPSKVSWNWNAMDVGPKRDLLGKLKHFLKFFQTKSLPELFELVNNYKPEVIWSDGDWEAPDTYWKAKEFLAWLYNESPVKDVVAVNDRWGMNIPCHHGGYYTCTDKYNPKKLQPRKWENAMTLDKGSWGYRRNLQLSDYLTTDELITTLAETVSCGGNLLLNIGPSPDGRIIPIFEERLRDLGSWLDINGEAIYESKPWKLQNDTVTPDVWYTSKGDIVYAVVLNWPKTDTITLSNVLAVTPGTKITMLGYPNDLDFSQSAKGVMISFPALTPNTNVSQWAWVLKFEFDR
nr:alpha-L-fucosidase [Parasteatoda tepidariorum]